ncbi:HD-GYP domain-containing protein [Pirellula sp. SH-Sr6A]|uniref:HD-GYP domain-containing protein n=1 Tax=Pirellula sp. SH-Sr6A TaxID=1632865 RepID=UPI0011BA9EFF|nr:HD domain-containing phosphohydrolase [Pirellula sp. SH-Sr6A]
MLTDPAYTIDTKDLPVGALLPFDLRDPSGRLVHKAGLPITDNLLRRLRSMGVATVTVRGEMGSDSLESLPRPSFDPALIAEIHRRLDATVEVLTKTFRDLHNAAIIDITLLRNCIRSLTTHSRREAPAILSIIAHKAVGACAELAQAIAERSARLAFVSSVCGIGMGLGHESILNIGIASMLADVSHLRHADWYDERLRLRPEVTTTDGYLQHSVESAQLIAESTRVDYEIVETISQLQEIGDGSGVPLGIPSSLMLDNAKIVQIADIYLQLADPQLQDEPYFESDVLGYLIHQAGKGRFDREIVRGLIQTLSMYPVGAMVRLSDDSLAVVVQANPNNPFQPIVRTLESGGRVIDLSVSSLFIQGPAATASKPRKRISKQMLDVELWRPQVSLDQLQPN